MTGRLVFVLVLATATAGRSQTATEPRVIHVAAERFAFTPSEITVDEGSIVELRLTSDDTDHGFRVYGLAIRASSSRSGGAATCGSPSKRRKRARTGSSARTYAEPATGSCAGQSV